MLAKRDRSVPGSCWPCKERRVACDLTRPVCSKCTTSRRECSYDPLRLRWKDGRARAKKKTPAPKTVPNVTALVHSPRTDPNEQHLSYFVNELSPRLKVGKPGEGVDIRSLYAQDAFRLVIIAASCTHQSMVLAAGGSRAARVQSIEAQQNAISALRKTTSSDLTHEALRHTFQASALLCVINGMLDPCDGGVSFRSHLEATKAILDRMDAPQRPLSQEIQPWSFFFSIFSTMELVNAILTGKRPLFSPDTWRAFGSCYCWWGTVPSDDPFIEVLSLLSQLATLGADMHQRGSSIEMGALLAMHSASHKPHAAPKQEEPDEWTLFCSIYRNAASLYLYRAIARLHLNHPLVTQAVADTMRLLQQLPKRSRSCSLLPMLLLGLNCAEHEDMKTVRGFLGDINNHLCFGAIGAVLECLDKHWRIVDHLSVNGRIEALDWWASLPDIADSACLF